MLHPRAMFAPTCRGDHRSSASATNTPSVRNVRTNPVRDGAHDVSPPIPIAEMHRAATRGKDIGYCIFPSDMIK